MTEDEMDQVLITDAEKAVMQLLIDTNEWSELRIERGSDEEWDFTIRGRYQLRSPGMEVSSIRFSAGPKRALIQQSEWVRYAEMSDYPDMVSAGDWSGVRDSCPEAIDAMFAQAILDAGIVLDTGMKP